MTAPTEEENGRQRVSYFLRNSLPRETTNADRARRPSRILPVVAHGRVIEIGALVGKGVYGEPRKLGWRGVD